MNPLSVCSNRGHLLSAVQQMIVAIWTDTMKKRKSIKKNIHKKKYIYIKIWEKNMTFKKRFFLRNKQQKRTIILISNSCPPLYGSR